MKLTVFQSADGDCLLLQSRDGRHMLIDGGKSGSYRTHAAPVLAALDALDVVCVSHIDEDHIGGVLALMDDALAWRVHQLHVDAGDSAHRAPRVLKPPPVRDLWHNGFGDQLGPDAVRIAGLLAATAGRLDFGTEAGDAWQAARHRTLATSVPQGIELSKRAGAQQLGIPLNHAFGGELVLVRDGAQPVPLGSIELTVIGPFEQDLAVLRGKWRKWLRENKDDVRKLQRRMREDVKSLESGEVERFRSALAAQADDLGDRKKVTAPNLASLMLLAREDGKSVLLTGDGHADDIVRGLEHSGDLPAGGGLHVDVLKVQHHGSLFNITPDFCRRVTADHYVFCSNGANDNPDPPTLDAIFAARLGAGATPFKLWFNSSARVAPAGDKRTHMAQVEQTVRAQAGRHPGVLSFAFLEDSFFELDP